MHEWEARRLQGAACPEGTFQSSALVFDCAGGSGIQTLSMLSGNEIPIAEIPAGAGNLEIELIAEADLDIRLVDPDEDGCVAGYGCTLAGSPPEGSSGEHAGMQIVFSGDMVNVGEDGKARTSDFLQLNFIARTK